MSLNSFRSFVLLFLVLCSLPVLTVCCGGGLALIYRAVDVSDSAYYFSSLIYDNGYLGNLSRVDEVYADSGILPDNDAFGHSAFDQPSGFFFFTSGNGQFIWSIHKTRANLTQFAQLPTQYSEVIGLNVVTLQDGSAMVVMTTVDTVYGAPISVTDQNGKLIHFNRRHSPKTEQEACAHFKKSAQESFALVPSQVKVLYSYPSVSISTDAVVTTSTADTVYIVDRTVLYTIALSSLPASLVGVQLKNSNSSTGSLYYTMDLQYHMNWDDPDQSRLVIVDSYRLFYVDPSNGQATFVIQLPDGPGFPRTNTLSFDQFFFSDFWYVYEVNLVYATVDSTQPFNSYYARGNFQFFY